jgi:hypothetical protein
LARSMRSLLTGTRAPSTDATNGRGICSRTATSPSS